MQGALDILLVEDEPSIRLPLGDAIRARGHRVRAVKDGAEALAALASQPFDILICDIRLPKVDGLTIFRKVRREAPATDVVLMTAYAAVPDAVAALKEGAADYIIKPFDLDDVVGSIQRLANERTAASAQVRARMTPSDAGGTRIVGRSAAIQRLLEQIEMFATSDAAVLITGESGAGKELVAQMLHEKSSRKNKAFVAVHCAAFPETLIEAELFGHERGAFTGALKQREGRFRAADGGTLFLDEVAEIPPAVQAKLLRVLQTGFIEPLGTNQAIKVDVRILAATHRDLRKQIAQGLFREDLFYRLNVLDLEVPPLRERRADLPDLVEHFLRRFAPAGAPCTISPRALVALGDYPFPGNIRELEHVIQRAVVLAKGGEIDLDHLPRVIVGRESRQSGPASPLRTLAEAMQEFEREYIVRALRTSGGRRGVAAATLGMSRKSLWKKIRGFAISPLEYGESGEEGEEEAEPEDQEA
jgi:two-component system, NtrC family, response regulator AtoC